MNPTVGLLLGITAITAQTLDPAGAARCEALRSLLIPDVVLTEAAPTPAAPGLPPFCMVHGEIDSRTGVGGVHYGIRFELRLPAAWERRFLFQGGGGMDGVVRPAIGRVTGAATLPALARGFAVVSTDAGHSGSPSDSAFSRDQQARIDNAYRSIDRVTLISKLIVARFYGEPWKRAYFAGCSNGGRQGLIAAQRFPTYFDGIVSGAPAFRVTRAAIGSAWETKLFLDIAPKDPEGRPILSRAYSESDLQFVANAILNSCDALDGAKDGLVFDTEGCRFDPAPLACGASRSGQCLTPDQVQVLKQVHAGPVDSRGQPLYSDWPWDPGIASPGWRFLKLGTSTTAQPNSADVTLMLAGLKGYFMTPYDPSFDPLKFDFDTDPAKVHETAALQDAEWTELSTFIDRGGKLLLYHGHADPYFSSRDTARYYRRAIAANSASGQDWARLFLVPGMTHCGGGPGLTEFDALDAIVKWVEQGNAPDRLDATGPAFPGRTLPLCAYPKFARYKGAGSLNAASSFECR